MKSPSCPLRDGVVERVVKPFEIVTVKLFF